MTKTKLSLSLLLLILMGAVLSIVPNLRVEEVSAVPASPYIMIIPKQTVKSTITPGMNYTISVYTDYSGSDVWGWQFGLTFNSTILQGLEVLNGDLISTAKNSRARFIPGTFDNSLGALSTTAAFFYQVPAPPPTTDGPGTLAYVKFRVVGTGLSNLTLGTVAPTRARLQGFNEVASTNYYDIIDASQPQGATVPPYGVDHIGHGSFNNIPGHDIAVINVVAPASAIRGDNIAINVTVENEGSFTEDFNLILRANATQVGEQTVTDLASGQTEMLTFMWNTIDTTAGNYVLNATAWLTTDKDLSDNYATETVVLATDTGHIAGTVTDASTGNPIEGATVSTSGYSDITDENGHYNMTNVPAGTYTITASKDGYEISSNGNVLVTAGQTTTLDFELAPPVNPIPPVILYAAAIVIAVVIIIGIALYLRRTRKAK